MSLVAWYPLNGDLLDYSSRNNPLHTVNAGLTEVDEGILGKCYKTAAKSSTACLTTKRPLDLPQGDHSMFCFINVQDLGHDSSANGVLTHHDHAANAGSGITLKARSATTFSASVNTGYKTGRTYHSYYGATTLGFNKWHHIGFTWNQELKRLRIYVDGKIDHERTISSPMYMPSEFLRLFCWSATYVTDANYRPAMKMNEVRIYDHECSGQEVKDIAQLNFMHWSFNNPVTNNLWVGEADNASSMRAHTKHYRDSWSEKISPPPIEAGNGVVCKHISGCLTSGGSGYMLNDITGLNDSKYVFSCWVYLTEDCDLTNAPVKVESHNGNGVVFDENNHQMPTQYDLNKKGTWQRLAIAGHNTDGTHLRFLFYPRCADKTTFTFNGAFYWTAPQIELMGSPDAHTRITPYTHPDIDLNKSFIHDSSGYGNHGLLKHQSPINVPGFSTDAAIGKHAPIFVNKVATNGEYGYIYAPDSVFLPMKGSMSFWIKGKRSNQNANNLYPVGYQHFCFMGPGGGSGGCRNGMIYYKADGSGYTAYGKSTPDIYNDDWHHVLITWDGEAKTMETYVNGNHNEHHHQPLGFRDMNKFRPFHAGAAWDIGYGGHSGGLDDIKLFGTILDAEDAEMLYKSKANLDKHGNFKVSTVESHGFKPTLIDYSKWVVGETAAPGFSRNGGSSENIIRLGSNPIGETDIVWAAENNDATSNSDGGWNGSSFPVNPNQMYRFSVWVRRKVYGNGSVYLGCLGSSVQNMSGSVNSNPYFFSGGLPSNETSWVLIVGYIFPHGTTSNLKDDHGIYLQDGTKVRGANTCFRWKPDTKSSGLRSYLYYSTNPETVQEFYRPRVDIVDGTEPSIDKLLECVEHRPLVDQFGNHIMGKTAISKDSKGDYLTLSEVGVTEGMVGYWRYKHNADDLSGNRCHGQPSSNVKFEDGGVKMGSAHLITYKNSNKHPMLKGDTQQAFTIVSHFKPLSASQKKEAMIFGKSGNHGGLVIENNKICSRNRTKAGPISHCYDDAVVQANKEYVAIITYDGKTTKLYVNGELKSTSTTPFDYEYGAGNFISGFSSDNYWFNGIMFASKLFSRELSEKEVLIETKYMAGKVRMQIDKKSNLHVGNIIEG